MPLGWPQLLDRLVRQYHFTNRGELLQLAISEGVYNSLKGKKIKRGTITPPTVVIGCRLPIATHQAVTSIAIKDKATVSVWAAMVVAKWWQVLQKEDSKQQKNNMYWLWLRDYAKNYQERVSVYSTKRGINEG